MLKIFITGGKGNIGKIIHDSFTTNIIYSSKYIIYAPSHANFDMLNFDDLQTHINAVRPDVIIHCAIVGGRRTNEDGPDVFYRNILMFENLIKCNFKGMIINMDSAAIYDRKSNILNRKETDIITIPTDYYGFSKYVIYEKTLNYNNIYNLRLFNIFHNAEEDNRFIKGCFLAKKNNTLFTIENDKYFDFVYSDDFVSILDYYIQSYVHKKKLEKVVNVCYPEKYKLSEIVRLIEEVGITKKINMQIIKDDQNHNYCGDGSLLKKNKKLNLCKLKNSLEKYSIMFI